MESGRDQSQPDERRLPTRLENLMTTFVVFIYLCAASTAPADCDRRTATDVALGPQAANELMCGLGAQEMMAQTAIRPKDGEYFKIACVRRKVVAGN
jgi:hypothetical protein